MSRKTSASFPWRFYFGSCLLLLSLVPWIFQLKTGHAVIFFLIWVIGYIEVCDVIIQKYSIKKVDRVSVPRRHRAVIGFIAGILIEYFGNTVWKLWYYPSLSLIIYIGVIPLILIGYFDILL